jgi:hypothetical protein
MPINGQEVFADLKTSTAPPSEGRSLRTAVDTKAATAKNTPRRRRRDRQDAPVVNGEERFFLANGDGDGNVPSLGRECPNEADAVIEAFRAKLTFYRVSEFQTRAEIGPSGEPVLRKEALKTRNPAS